MLLKTSRRLVILPVIPPKIAYSKVFLEIVGWAFDNNADDIDFVVDSSSETSRVCFKVGGSYLRPDRWKINTETLNNVIAISSKAPLVDLQLSLIH